MNKLSNTTFVKSTLMLALSVYILVLVLGLSHSLGLKRYITIENMQQYGVVAIRDIKYPTPYRTQQARIVYSVNDPLEYLLIPSGIYRESLISASLKLAIAVLFSLFVWKFDFQDPFQPQFLIRAYLIYRLFIGSILLSWLTGVYTAHWSGSFFYQSNYHLYADNNNITGYMVLVVLLTVGLYMYTRAVKNKQELDLTI